MLHPLGSLWRYPVRVLFYASDAMPGTRRRFCSTEEALDYLRYWLGTPDARAELKSLLQRCGPSLVGAYPGSDGWLRGLAARLSSGAVVVVEEPQAAGKPGRLVAAASAAAGADDVAGLPLLSDIVASPVVAAPEAAAPAHASGASAVSPAPDREPDREPNLQPDQEAEPEPEGPVSAADQVTQAETLEQAARDGTPFCEICNAAQAADTAAPERAEVDAAADQPDQPDQLDQAAQAETLEQAARDGTPFCEICVASRTAAQT